MPCHRLLLPALAAVFLLGGCAGESVDRSRPFHRDPSLTAEQDLARFAQIESRSARRVAESGSIPAPPGVEAPALGRRDPLDPKATVPLADVLARLAARAAAPEPGEADAPIEPPGPDAVDQAVRHYLKARGAALNGDHLTAAFELEKARELDPSSTAVLRELAHSYAAQRNTPKAAALFRQILGLDPDDSEARFTLALAAAGGGDFQRAAVLLARPRVAGRSFTHDGAADLIADFTLHVAMQRLGYDRASIEAAAPLVSEPFPLDMATYHRQRVLSLHGQRGEIWRAIGDAHCRLGEYEQAVEAYEHAASFDTGDASALRQRVIYANLNLGRAFTAQHELVAALRAGAPSVSEGDIRLCGYVAEHAADSEVFVQAVLDLHQAHPDDPGLARAAAVLLPADEARDLLARFITRRPRDLPVVGQLLVWLGEREPSAAVDLAASLLADQPDLAEAYIDRLLRALPDPFRAIEALSDPVTPRHAQLRARVLMRLWTKGQAWECCRRGLEQWPDDAGLRLLKIQFAGELDEPPLLEEAMEQAADFDDAWSWLVRARALREIEAFDEAIEAAETALARASETGAARDRVAPLLELARVHAARAAAMPVNEQRDAILRRAAELADEARALAPQDDEPYELLLGLYGAAGPLSDADRFRQIVSELRQANENGRFYARLVIQDDLQNRRYELALTRALKLFEDGSNDFDNLSLAILAWQQLGRSDEAEQWLRDRLARRPGDPALLEQLVRHLLGRERVQDARTLLEARMAEAGDDPAARRLLELVSRVGGDHEQAVALGERRLNARPEGTRRALEMAALYARAEREEPAADQLRWIAEHARLASLGHLIGAVGLCSRLQGLGDRREELTLALVEAASARFAEVPLQLYGLGLAAIVRLEGTGERFDALARQAATKARGADDMSAQGAVFWQTPAQGLVDAGSPDATAGMLRIRLAGAPDLEEPAVALLASMALIADAVSPDGASRSIDLLIDLQNRGLLGAVPGLGGAGTLSEALMQVGNLYTLVGNREGAESLLRESIRLDPSNGMAMNNLGYQRLEDGHGDAETIAWIERAGELVPDNASVLDTVAWLRYKQGRLDDEGEELGAVSLLQRAIELSEEPTAELFDHLGDALWRQGRAEDAVEAWRRAVEILEDPQQQEQLLQAYALGQTRVWGLLVRDPQAMYDRDYGVVFERTQQKLLQVERGGDPPVAPTFQELAPPK